MKTAIKLAAIFLVLFCFFSGCLDSKCNNKILNTWLAPNNKNEAIHLLRNCGATTAYAHVIIIKQKFQELEDIDPNDFVFTMQGDVKIEAKWISNNKLLIIRPNYRKNIFHELEKKQDIQVVYADY